MRTRWYKCLKCTHVLSHSSKGGKPQEKDCFAATSCKSCGHLYVKRVKDKE